LIANIGPCIKIDTSSSAYLTGIEDQIFLEGIMGQTITGKNRKVGTCNYPDFFNPDTDSYWNDMLTSLNSVFNFSGIWLDDNEIYDLAASKILFLAQSTKNFL
jgi:alpha-glucosidase